MASVLHPLYQLLKKDLKYTWTSAAQKAFDTVKEMITSDTVLAHYNPDLSVKLACDSSAYGLGAVISRHGKWWRETYCIRLTYAKFCWEKLYTNSEGSISYRRGSSEISLSVWKEIYASHGSSAIAVNLRSEERIPATTASRMKRYALFLQGHDYNIEYKSSKSHANCKGLSRLPYSHSEELPDSDSVEIYYLSQTDSLPVNASDVKRETRRDPTLSKVLDLTLNGWKGEGGAAVFGGDAWVMPIAQRETFSGFQGRQYDLSRRVDTASSGSPRQSRLKHIVLNNNNNEIANNAPSKIQNAFFSFFFSLALFLFHLSEHTYIHACMHTCNVCMCVYVCVCISAIYSLNLSLGMYISAM